MTISNGVICSADADFRFSETDNPYDDDLNNNDNQDDCSVNFTPPPRWVQFLKKIKKIFENQPRPP